MRFCISCLAIHYFVTFADVEGVGDSGKNGYT